ncbi:hypothetical protein QTP70_010891 [Hemibagrus guttatus]|uniref:C-type lectin domain-containing protein n=1 Tax=Hemibagrus guttatus TaxID=175788 RepID=A0AAE0V6N6_9TELE|nr:hypothetical protein QTP70_010891 [Hemibagrus guttatus]
MHTKASFSTVEYLFSHVSIHITSWYREKDREVKTSTRRDKRRHIEQLAEDAERAAEQKDMKTVYMTTKKLRGDRGQNQDIPVRAKDGTPITEEYAKLERWKEHFRQILNRPDPPALADIPEADEDLDIDMGDIRVEEVKAAIHKMKNGKAPGEDGVCPEMLKAEEEETPLVLQCVLQDIWEKERCPDIWRIGTIIKLPKKGDLGDCNNWRGITLLSLMSKVFCRIILQRIIAAVDIKLRQEQAGFRKGKSCINHIFMLRQILEQSHEWNSPLYLVFVDFEKAFDSLQRDSLWKILRHYGIPKKLVTIIQDLYKNFECRVIHNNELTEPFNVHTGVKQGCILSPILFSLAIDWLMRSVTEGQRRGIQWTLTTALEDLDYADDLGLLAHRHQDIQQKTERLSEIASTIGLKVNNKKTQVLRKNVTSNTPIAIDGTPLEDVQEFVYLGSKVTTDGDCNKDINTRVSKANQAFAMLKPIWRTTSLSIHTKIKIFRSNVISVLLYGSECWKTTTAIEQKLEVFQNKCLRRILKIFWPNTISNEELRRRTGFIPLMLSVPRKYYLIQQGTTWSNAQVYCRATHTDLAIIQSNEDMIQLQNEAQRQQFSSSAWIGLYIDPSSWRWSMGNEPAGTIQWSPGEPDNWAGHEECGAITPTTLGDVIKRQVVRVNVRSNEDVNDPPVKTAILEQINQKLKDRLRMENITVKWRKQPDGVVFQKVLGDGGSQELE